MKVSELRNLIREVLQELNEMSATSVGGASFTAGQGAQYATSKAFSSKKSNKATENLKKLGYKTVKQVK